MAILNFFKVMYSSNNSFMLGGMILFRGFVGAGVGIGWVACPLMLSVKLLVTGVGIGLIASILIFGAGFLGSSFLGFMEKNLISSIGAIFINIIIAFSFNFYFLFLFTSIIGIFFMTYLLNKIILSIITFIYRITVNIFTLFADLLCFYKALGISLKYLSLFVLFIYICSGSYGLLLLSSIFIFFSLLILFNLKCYSLKANNPLLFKFINSLLIGLIVIFSLCLLILIIYNIYLFIIKIYTLMTRENSNNNNQDGVNSNGSNNGKGGNNNGNGNNNNGNGIPSNDNKPKKKKYKLTSEQRQRYYARRNEKRKQKRKNMTEEQREAENSKRRIANLTQEQAEKKRANDRVANMTKGRRQNKKSGKRIEDMTPEQVEKQRTRKRVANMTEEQRENKRASDRRYREMGKMVDNILNAFE